jgi:dGTPase
LILFLDFVAAKWTKQGGDFNRSQARAIWRELAQLITLSEPFQPLRSIKVAVHESTSALIASFMDRTSWEGDAPCRFQGNLIIEPDARLGCELLKELIWCYVIERPHLQLSNMVKPQ